MCYKIWVFNQWFDNLYSFLHPAKHGFLFILKNVLFREINDTEIPTHNINLKKNDLKKSMLSYILYLGEKCAIKKKFNLKTAA